MTNVFQQQLLHFSKWSSNQLLNLIIFSFLFLQTFLFINSSSLCFNPWIFCHLLANLFPSFWLFLVLFWMLWMLVTVFKPCHVLHASRITTSETLFMEKFSVSKESVRSWSHASLIIYHKTFAKKLKAVRPKSCREREKEKEKERQLQSVMR